MTTNTTTLEDLRDEIDAEAEWVDIKPYSHNIISLLLRQIARTYGPAEADRAIRDFGLEEKGWRQEEGAR